MQHARTYRTNRDLFSTQYLDAHLPETDAWTEVGDDELRSAYDDVAALWERERDTAPERDESRLEETFVRPLFRTLGIPFEVDAGTDRTRRRPDYGFLETEDAARGAFARRESGGDFYEDAVAVADARRWDRPLDSRGSGDHERGFENPSHRVHVALQETPARWAVLTNGQRWRLYHGPSSGRLDSYYEVDLPAMLERGDLEAFKYFYLFFRHEAFLEDASGDCFLDDVYDASNAFARELGENLQDDVYEAITVLSEGFLRYPENDLGEADLGLIRDSSLVYLYRSLFVLYAEAAGRDLLDTSNERYEPYSLNALKRAVAAELDGGTPSYRDGQDELWDRLDELFALIDRGSRSRGIPEEDVYVPAYNGGLFRTDPDGSDGPEAQFLAEHRVGDAHLARVVDLLARSENADGGGPGFVDYSSLDVRHLGRIYEGLLECRLDVADEPLALEDGEYVRPDAGDDVAVEAGEVYLTTDGGERKATGSYYTPEYVVEYIVENTLEPLVADVREAVVGRPTSTKGDADTGTFADRFAERVFELTILDPAMGSGRFLTGAVDYLAREIIDAQERQAARRGLETVDEDHDIDWARRQVAQRCLYGVDLNPFAVELAKVSLWLRTFADGQPLAFLDHHLKTGNSLVGSDVAEFDPESGGDGWNAALAGDDAARTGERVMQTYGAVVESQEPADVEAMAATYRAFERTDRRRRLEAMANVRTAEKFGLETVPSDAYERMAAALDTDRDWEALGQSRWFRDAQAWAEDEQYFHWPLEYPDVFYTGSGDRRSDPGFDAVIGNPPYIRSRNLPDAHKAFHRREYRSATGAYDIYIPFLERAAALGDRRSFVVPNKWTTTAYGARLRDLLLDEYGLRELVDVSRLDVFPDADVYPLIVSYSSTRGADTEGISIRHVEEPGRLDSAPDVRVSRELIDQLGGRVIPVNLTPAFAPILEKALAQESRLGDHVRLTEAIHTGNVREKLVVDERVDENCEKLADGTSIDRYHVEWSGEWIRYDEDVIESENGEYGDLRTRDLFDRDEKLFIRDISYRPVAAYDDRRLFALNTLYSVTRTERSEYGLKYLLAIFNSTFVTRYFRRVYGGTHVGGDYLRFKPMFVSNIPIPEPDHEGLPAELERRVTAFDPDIETSSTVAAIADLTDVIRDSKERKRHLDPNIRDFLGEYAAGQTLTDLSGYRPPQGVSESLLSETASTVANLRVGSVELSEDPTTLTILLSARYKPAEPGEFETDRWGYTETELAPAMAFVGLEETERLLVREFVPYAIEEAGGFAGFRETATKTNSLIDRLAELTLPAIADVEADLQRYRERMQQANRLDERAETADELLDEIIADLYGLTRDEKRLIEAKSG